MARKKEASAQARAIVFTIHAKLISLAAAGGVDPSLNSTLADAIANARKEAVVAAKKVADFTFVINDRYTYNAYTDFKSASARNLYFEANEKRKVLVSTEKELEDKRTEYITVSGNQRSSLASIIQNLETRQAQLYKEVQELEIKARNEEIKNLK